MMKTRAINKKASKQLNKCWCEAIFISIFNIALFMVLCSVLVLTGRFMGVHTADTVLPVFSSVSPLFAVMTVFIISVYYIFSSPIYYGTKWFFWQAACGNIMPVSSIFASYSSKSRFFRCLKLRFVTDMRKLSVLLAFAAVTALELFLGSRIIAAGSGEYKNIIYIACAALTAALVCMYFFVSLNYVPVGFLLANDPDAVISDIVKQSTGIVGKNYMSMLKMYAAYTGYAIACLLAFPVISFIPWYNISMALFIREAAGKPPQAI